MSKITKLENFYPIRVNLPLCPIVHCHGVFDILHAGHLAYLKSAKKLGKTLVVTLTSDRYVNKGPGKPIFPAEVRAEMLAALEIVDFVMISDYPTAVPAIEAIKPDYYIKGPDYRDRTKDVTGEIYNEEAAVKKHGGQIAFTDDETFSSSTLANRFFVKWTDEQQKTIDRVKQLGGMDLIGEMLDRIAELKVVTVGEPIIDTYRFCDPQGISSKSPSISAKFMFEENYEGGATAIVKHLESFVKSIELVVPEEFPAAQKIRYIAIDKSQRIFEITHIQDDFWASRNPASFIQQMLTICNDADLTILADFGHGLFEGRVLAACSFLKTMVALNVQTNSSNLPFNPFTKHEFYDYLSIDTRELRVAYHDKKTPPADLHKKALSNKRRPYVSLTCGANGAYYNDCFSPAFADSVVDATGAGDAYFAITSCLVKVGCPSELIPFVGNVFAGLKTKIIGNKSAVTKAQLIKALAGILK